MQDAVDDGLAEVVRLLRADHDVAELAGTGRGTGFVDREGEHVGGLVDSAVAAVQATDVLGGDQLDGQVTLVDPRRGQGGLRRRAQGFVVAPDDLYVDQAFFRAGRRPGACAARSA